MMDIDLYLDLAPLGLWIYSLYFDPTPFGYDISRFGFRSSPFRHDGSGLDFDPALLGMMVLDLHLELIHLGVLD